MPVITLPGIRDHVQSESVITLLRNTHLDEFLRNPNMDLITGRLSPKPLGVTAKAHDAIDVLHDKYEVRMHPDHEFGFLRNVTNKMSEQAVRIAGGRAGLEGKSELLVEHIDCAEAITDWYYLQWETLTARVRGMNKDTLDGRRLWNWMTARCAATGQTEFKAEDIYRSGPRFLRGRIEQTREVLIVLIRRGYVRQIGSLYGMNPAAL